MEGVKAADRLYPVRIDSIVQALLEQHEGSPANALLALTRYLGDTIILIPGNWFEEEEQMTQIWKWHIPIVGIGSFTLDIPDNARFLTCQVQGKTPVLWAVVGSTKPREYKFHVFGTGVPDKRQARMEDLTYIGTYQLMDGAFVGHLFVQGAIKL